ncbi:MAG: autotransporter-associated beta strand repeat-containing protein, partial [Prosthecobacter sp.]|nr:autotransporter-associated beta strand repeat-containing protein [Prosthecobacter sp.]
TEITGTGGLTKAGAQTIYFDNTNSYSGTTNIAEGILDVRDSGGLGNSTLVQTHGSGSLYLELGTVLPDTVDLRIGVLDTSRTVLKSNAGNNTFKGNIIVDNVDDLGNLVYTPYINVNTGDTLNLDGLIYGALASNPLSSDTSLNDARIVSTNGSSSGIININGTFQDNINGAGTAVSGATENELLRFQVTGNNQVVVNVRNQWNAAGNILLERGYLRYEGEGNFWTDDAASAITPTNSQSGMRISGSSSTNTGNVSFILTKDGQKLNIDRIDIGANGGSDNYNDLGNVMLAGTNTSGTVTFGNGTERIVYQSSDSARSHTRDLSLYAAGGGTVNLDFRLDDVDSDVHTSFTKIGRGVVNFNGQNGSNAGDVEQVNLSGGLLRLTNYGAATNTRFDNGAMVIFAGGGIELDGIGSVGNETENFTGTAVGGSSTVPTGTIEVRPGATDIIVTSDAGRTTTLNIGDSTIDLLRSSGGTLHFVENSNGGTSAITLEGKAGSSLPATGSAIAWATYGDTYTYDASSASYTINALDFATITGTEDIDSLAGSLTRENTDDVSTWTNGNDVSENATGFTGTTGLGIAVNTLHFDHDGASTLTVDAGGLEVTSGGIMVSSAVATLGSTKLITGGDLTTSAGTDLIIHQFGRDTLTIASNIVDNGGTALVKAGSGDLILTGSANTYAGGTFLNGGTLVVDDISKLGATPASTDASNLYFNGGALRFTASTTIDTNRGIMLGGNGGEINVDASAIVTYGGFIDAEPNVISNYAANPAVGRLDKTGLGTLLLTQVANQNFAGLLDIKEGTLSWAPDVAVPNNSVINAFGTNDAFLDGTIVRSGATLDISPASASGITSNVFFNEWITFEAGSTFNVSENSDDNRGILMRGVLRFESNGKTGFEAATIIDVNRNTLQVNDDGGYLTGDGNIFKTGAGNLYLRENSPEYTGQWIIAEGLVAPFSAGAP